MRVNPASIRNSSECGTEEFVHPESARPRVARSTESAVLVLQSGAGNRATTSLLASRSGASASAALVHQQVPTGITGPVRSARPGPPVQRLISVQRDPTLTIVDSGSSLSDKELATVRTEAKKALDDTTRKAKDSTLKKKGVTVTAQRGLAKIEEMRKKGVILVYLVHDLKDDAKREETVRKILTAEGALKGKRLEEVVTRVTSDLKVTESGGKTFGQHIRDPASNVAFINVDLISGRKAENLRAIAGDVLHEGVGHRAIPAPAGEATYHNQQHKGVMSEKVRDSANEKDVQFQGDERDRVNEFLKNASDNPEWNKD
ncbi:MAG TPA: hypothetical protein VIJ00_06070 [Nakamurella sp.]